MSAERLVVGVDGCRSGWVVVIASAQERTPIRSVEVVDDISTVIAAGRSDRYAAIAIDMPIGLPDSGTRACEPALRKLLGARSSSVFPVPPRGVLGSATHEEAVRRGREIDGRGVTIQAFNILRKIEQLDGSIDPDDQRFTFESHPESAFALLAGAPLTSKKRLVAGREERLALLADPFPDSADLLRSRPRGCAPDDVLDAAAIAWSARRWLEGEALEFGDDSLDARGLRMRVII